jgi:hypothetical protein
MPRLEVFVGQMPLSAMGVIRSSPGPFDARWNPPHPESRQAASVPPKPPRKRPCCKTCGDGRCVGHCKF